MGSSFVPNRVISYAIGANGSLTEVSNLVSPGKEQNKKQQTQQHKRKPKREEQQKSQKTNKQTEEEQRVRIVSKKTQTKRHTKRANRRASPLINALAATVISLPLRLSQLAVGPQSNLLAVSYTSVAGYVALYGIDR
jgi:hypothetical protein